MITLKAYAKLNLSLAITGIRPDGYHELDTIMQSISFYDTVTITKRNGIRVQMDIDGIDEKDNTAYAAADAFVGYTKKSGADIAIQKNIPRMAGLGGASADAAAVLLGLDRLYGTGLDKKTLLTLGKSVGADVPFALFGGTARVSGIGEKLKRLNPKKNMYYVVVKPHQGVSTAEAFSKYQASGHISIDTVEYAVLKGDTALFSRYAANALGMAALSIAPDMMKAAAALKGAGAKKALMTGSGSAMFAAFETEKEARDAAENIRGRFALCGAFAPKDTGIEVIGDEDAYIL
ncbi:MAG: 4-(cytidine 5'-diphospho)-2-C-methyl-D-erythritol kinase [Eubacteriales bacterium]|nr:4-(cytidine 5'-diphospho)-2-C-methyl-D-erythritol kinase [Eubacteriales bacterium]